MRVEEIFLKLLSILNLNNEARAILSNFSVQCQIAGDVPTLVLVYD